MYRAVDAVLSGRSDWRKTASAVHFDLLLAERWHVPYARLGRDTPARQAVNHQRGTKGITVKGLMVKALRAHCDITPGVEIGDIIPETHLVVPGEPADAPERVSLLAAAPGEAWICKPTAGAHGAGIHVARTAAEAVAHVDASVFSDANVEKETRSQTRARQLEEGDEAPGAGDHGVAGAGTGERSETSSKPWRRGPVKTRSAPAWLVQRYVARPMLLDGRKFDIRAFVLVAHDGAVHFYHDWIVRTCSEVFDMNDLGNRTAHISNHCVQVQSDKYGAREEAGTCSSSSITLFRGKSESSASRARRFLRVSSRDAPVR